MFKFDILMQVLSRYVPRCPDGLEKILIGGDRLTEGNCRNIQLGFADGETGWKALFSNLKSGMQIEISLRSVYFNS